MIAPFLGSVGRPTVRFRSIISRTCTLQSRGRTVPQNPARTGAMGLSFGILVSLAGSAFAETHGRVSDLNGAPLVQAMVTLTKVAGASGATATTVFTNEQGEFGFAAGA